MTKLNLITAGEFLDAFRKTWDGMSECEKDEASEKFQSKLATPWTEYMLTGDNTADNNKSFLMHVAEKLGFSKWKEGCDGKNVHYIEYNRIDMALMRNYEEYPCSFDVLIEHENDQQPENEMWKLMLLRSPLKVIVFYDHYNKPELQLNDKLDNMSCLLKKANAAFPENKKTCYLFIVGKVGEDNKLGWRYYALRNKRCVRYEQTEHSFP